MNVIEELIKSNADLTLAIKLKDLKVFADYLNRKNEKRIRRDCRFRKGGNLPNGQTGV